MDPEYATALTVMTLSAYTVPASCVTTAAAAFLHQLSMLLVERLKTERSANNELSNIMAIC